AIVLPTGEFALNELEQVLNHLPFDITFVDKNDVVKYFSQGKDRIFVRTKAVIGRNVSKCHPPASVHVVENIVADFKSGKKDHEDFWINMGDTYVYIRYFAVRDEAGEYLGVVEVTQDIKPIQAITGEKRLVE
ncbi:MAG TPA: PAS domain-containing protein, partial [Clostridiales bacterium]|nr:PAS domain-containing protein [Clostridiales bacterium]